MNLEDFLKLGLEEFGDGRSVLEVEWRRPRGSQHLKVSRRVSIDNRIGLEIPVDPNLGDAGYILCYYLRLVPELSKEYKEGNVEPPFIEVCPTKERNGVPNNNMVQIPLDYIRGILQLSKKA